MSLPASKLSIALIPGGPGLTTATLSEFFEMDLGAEVIAIEPDPSSEDVCYEAQLRHAREQVQSLNGEIVLCGHSAGGILATDLALSMKAKIGGLIVMAAPFSKDAWDAVNSGYTSLLTPELKDAETTFSVEPSDISLQNWFANYGEIYFAKENVESGRQMLLQSPHSHKLYAGATHAMSEKAGLLRDAAALNIPKLFIAGDQDRLVPPSSALKEVAQGLFELQIIAGAGHFMSFDEPKKVETVIRNFINQFPKGRDDQ